MNTINAIVKQIPADIKAAVKKGFNTEDHAKVYGLLEAHLGEAHCIYTDGTVYAIAKKIAGK